MSKALVLIAIFTFLAQPVFAYTYLNIYIDSSGNSEFLGETNETSLALPQGIFIQDGKIRGTTQDLTAKTGEIWTFQYSLRDSEIKTILPEGAVIKNISNGEIFLERSRISVYFTDGLSVSYAVNGVSGSNAGLIWLIVILLASGSAAYYYRKKLATLIKPKVIYKKPKKKDHIDMIKHVLNEREKLILDKLKFTGKVKMSHLRKLCEIPKASFSRHVQELEKKKLLTRSGEGKNKFVQLAKKGF